MAFDRTHVLLAANGVALRRRPAGVVRRAVAAAIDHLAWLVGIGGLVGAASLVAPRAPEGAAQVLAALTVGAIALVTWTWPTAFELLWAGRTPGKRVLGLRVVARDGGAIGLRRSAIRNLLRVVDLLPAVGGAALLAALLDPHGRRLGDIAAGTLVVDDPLAPPWRRRPRGPRIELPPAWTARRLRAELGPEGVVRLLELEARAERLDPLAAARLRAAWVDHLAARLGPPPRCADAVLLASLVDRLLGEGRDLPKALRSGAGR